ncbi:hypothetical protein ACQP2K_09100 [Microbispora siamensis]
MRFPPSTAAFRPATFEVSEGSRSSGAEVAAFSAGAGVPESHRTAAGASNSAPPPVASTASTAPPSFVRTPNRPARA